MVDSLRHVLLILILPIATWAQRGIEIRLPISDPHTTVVIQNHREYRQDVSDIDLIAYPAQFDLITEKGSDQEDYRVDIGHQRWAAIDVSDYASALMCLRNLKLSADEYIVIREEDGKAWDIVRPEDTNAEGLYTTSFIRGPIIYIEHVSRHGDFTDWYLDRLYVSYDDHTWTEDLREFGSSWPCHVNVNCPEGEDWQDQKRSACRIIMVLEEGIGNCSGNLMNNVRMDGTPYILSAFHCRRDFTPIYSQWRFNFLYFGQGCTNPDNEPQSTVMIGCRELSSRAESDFLLLELLQDVNPFHELYFSGWTADEDSIAETGTMLHHPSGDIQKISAQFDTVEVWPNAINWGSGNITPPNHHFRINLTLGTFQSGSSGAPLFDHHGKTIGQLHGGNSDCDGLARASYGRLSKSWDEGEDESSRLMDWLDPDQSGLKTLDGYYLEVPDTTRYRVDVTVRTPDGIGMASVINWEHLPTSIQAVYLGDGRYRFSNIIPGTSFQLQPAKNDHWMNGIDSEDIVLLKGHVEQTASFTNPVMLEIADLNRSGEVNTQDFAALFNIFHEKSKLPRTQEPWIFLPELITVENIESNIEIDIMGIKLGDLNLNRQVNE